MWIWFDMIILWHEEVTLYEHREHSWQSDAKCKWCDSIGRHHNATHRMHRNAISCLHLGTSSKWRAYRGLLSLGQKQFHNRRPLGNQHDDKTWQMCIELRKIDSPLSLSLFLPPHSLKQWPKLGGRLSTYAEILVVIGENSHVFACLPADILENNIQKISIL